MDLADGTPVTPRPRPRAVFDWWFRNRGTGRITVAQWPNVALWLTIAASVVQRLLVDHAGARTVARGVGLAAFGWWSLDEVVRGVNPWRRLLGVLGGVACVGGAVSFARHR